MKKENKIRKQIMLSPYVSKKLIELSNTTGYSQSEIIEMGLKKLDDNFEKKLNVDIKDVAAAAGLTEKQIINIALKKIIS